MSDARAFQSSLKLELFDLLRSTINLPVTQIFYFLPHVLTNEIKETTKSTVPSIHDCKDTSLLLQRLTKFFLF